MISAVVPSRQTPLPLQNAIEQVARFQSRVDAAVAARQEVEQTPTNVVKEAASVWKAGQRPRNAPGAPLDQEDQARLAEMRARDKDVRDQKAAQARAAAPYAGAANFEYETGPDGRQYAVSGEVKIDVSATVGDASETARKMEQILSATLAADELSVEDRRVLAEARKQRLEAQTDIIAANAEQRAGAAEEEARAEARREAREASRDDGAASKRLADAAREVAEQKYAETQNLEKQQVVVSQIDIAA